MCKKYEVSFFGNKLIYDPNYSIDYVEKTIKNNALSGLKVNTFLGDSDINSLDFLGSFKFLQSLEITGSRDYDFSFLEELGNLVSLDISIPGKGIIDLRNQRSLVSLSLDWRRNAIRGLSELSNLKNLCLVDFKEEDLLEISCLNNLNSLIIKTSSIKSLKGIELLSSLIELSIGNCRYLSKIEEISNLDLLEKVSFIDCKKIYNLNQLSSLKNLTYILIDNCGDVESIQFLSDLKKVKSVHILRNTTIIDGNLSSLDVIDDVAIRNKKSYNRKISNPKLIKKNKDFLNSLKDKYN